jgi:hypothetical protein
MRQHPIPPVTEPNQYRAIGVVRGTYVPAEADVLTRGLIRTAEGDEIEAVVLGRLLTLMRRHLDLSEPHLWVVYPRCREQDRLHLQMVGVWEPSTLSAGEPEGAEDALPEGDDYFSVRGELIFTRPESGDLVVKVRQQPRSDGTRPVPFKLQLKGTIPLEHLRHFVGVRTGAGDGRDPHQPDVDQGAQRGTFSRRPAWRRVPALHAAHRPLLAAAARARRSGR